MTVTNKGASDAWSALGVRCDQCGGDGLDHETPWSLCDACYGLGEQPAPCGSDNVSAALSGVDTTALPAEVERLRVELVAAQAQADKSAITIARLRKRIAAVTRERNELRDLLFDQKKVEAIAQRHRMSAQANGATQ